MVHLMWMQLSLAGTLMPFARSYTTFSFKDPKLGAVSYTSSTVTTLSVVLANTGQRAGSEVDAKWT